MSFNYVMSPTARQFHESDKPVKMICGPYGSGKSCTCAVDVLAYACAQNPAPDGMRYSRVGVIRSTYNELLTTTRKSLLEVLPSECGTITSGGLSPRGLYTIPLPDGTTVQLELNLIALATVDDCEKLKSVNWSFAWINEATGIIPEVFGTVQQRVSRYPAQDFGGVSWGGIIMDFNMPAHGTWLFNLMSDPPKNYAVFRQPPAAFERENANGEKVYEINPEAENLRNIGGREEGDPETFESDEAYEQYLIDKGMRYYRNQIDTQLRLGRVDIVRNQYCMLDVPIVDGKPVFPSFNPEKHVATRDLAPVPFIPIIIGSDTSGIHPAAVIVQNQHGKWCVLDELYADGEGLENFLNGMLIPLLRQKYSSCKAIAALDPANARDNWTGVTPRTRFEELGIESTTDYSNSPKIRIQTVEHLLNLDIGGILISPHCDMLVRAMVSEYRYRRMRAHGVSGAVYTPQPEKNDYSHIADAMQYACMYIQSADSLHADDTESAAKFLSERRKLLTKVV